MTTPSTNFTITAPVPETLPSLTRLTRTLLPINYPDKFFTALLQPPSHNNAFSLAKVAIWHDSTGNGSTGGQVVGGICGRILPGDNTGDQECQLYIATLAVLAPWRGQGIAAALLKELVNTAVNFANPISNPSQHMNGHVRDYSHSQGQGQEPEAESSTLVSHRQPGLGRLTSVFAHVWETNDTGLDWYKAQGFDAGDVVKGYYRKLKPDGARIVRRDVLGLVLEDRPWSSVSGYAD